MKMTHWMVLVVCIGMIGIGVGCSDSDGGSSADGDADSDTDTDTGTGLLLEMRDCAGGKLDPVTNLCWEDPPSDDTIPFHAAVSYCENLVLGDHKEWRLPNIDELLSLIRGCQEGTVTGDLSRSLCTMTPEECVKTERCSSVNDCSPCLEELEGPGADGCYWDPALSGLCRKYWSSTQSGLNAWHVYFNFSEVNQFFTIPSDDYHARCVRSGP